MRTPWQELLVGRHAGVFWQMFGLMTGLWLMTQVVVLYLGRRLAEDGLPDTAVSLVMAAAAIAQATGMSMTGHASTRVGRRRFLVGWGLLAALAGPLLWLAVTGGSGVVPVALAAGALQVVTVCGYGPVGAYLTERLPRQVRATGYGTAYSASIVLPALWPFWLPWLAAAWGTDTAVVVVLVAGGLLVAGAAALGPRLSPSDLAAPVDDVAARAGGILAA